MDFSETIAASDLNGSRSRHLIEFIRYVSIEGQGHFFTIYFPGFVCFVLYLDKISGERLQDHWSSGLYLYYIFTTFKILRSIQVQIQDSNSIHNASIRGLSQKVVDFLNSKKS